MNLSSKECALKWLEQELPKWEQEQIITAKSSVQLRQRYELNPQGYPNRRTQQWGILLISILGTGLICSGIISIFAYNWDSLGRPLRAFLSLLPLLIMQALAWRTLTKWNHSAAIRESINIGWLLSIGAAIALIAQTYHISGRFDQFLLAWLTLGIPTLYLLRSGFAFALLHWGLLIWIGSGVPLSEKPGYYYLLLLGATLPYYWWIQRPLTKYTIQKISIKWVLALLLPLQILLWLVSGNSPNFLQLILPLYFTSTFLADQKQESLIRRPFALVGILGMGILMLIYSRGDLSTLPQIEKAWWLWGVTGTLTLFWILKWARSLVHLELWMFAMGSLPIVMCLNYLQVDGMNGFTITLYTLFIGVVVAAEGYRKERLLLLNYGFLLLGLLAVLDFLDDKYSFLEKGISFIILGVLFLSVNLFIIRRKHALYRRKGEHFP